MKNFLIITISLFSICFYGQTTYRDSVRKVTESNTRGLTKYKLGDYQGAIQDYNQALRLDSTYTYAYNNRGIAKKNLKDYQGAIQDYNKAIELKPNYAEAYYSRGIAKYNLSDTIGACLDWKKAKDLEYKGAIITINKYCK
jgi:tetratricopeptide (TPR) repeat protein